MPYKLNVTGEAEVIDLNFNKAAGIKALDIKNKFIGIDTSSKSFQHFFEGYPIVQKIFNSGYSKYFSKSVKISGAKIEASGELLLAKVYAKTGILVESAGYNLGGVKIKGKQTGSVNLLASVPTNDGNGIRLSAQTISAFSGNPSLSVKLPDAYVKAKLLADIDIGALAFDSKIKGSLLKASKTIDLPRISLLPGIKTKPPISIPLVDYSIQKVLKGEATGIYGKKQTNKGILEAEYEGIKIKFDARNIGKSIKTNPDGSLTGEIPLIALSASLNKLGAKAFPALNLLAKRIEGSGYLIDYKLLDLSFASNLKIKYDGKLKFSGQKSSVTFEDGKTLVLSGAKNGVSNSIQVLNTTELKKLLDSNNDGKATAKFDWSYKQVNYALNYGLYADLSATIAAGQFKINVGTKIDLKIKTINANTDLVNISLFDEKTLQILKDFKLIGGITTIPIPTDSYNFSKTVQFNIPTNADDLINLLGLNPISFYYVQGTSGNDKLVTRTEKGDDHFNFNIHEIEGVTKGIDTMIGGLGNDEYEVVDADDTVVEEANAGYDTINVLGSVESYALPDNVEVLYLYTDPKGDRFTAYGNSLDNTIYGNSSSACFLLGNDGNDILSNNRYYYYTVNTNDTLDGGKGADTMEGGKGNDIYRVDDIGDVVVEDSLNGVDIVESSLSNYTLTVNVENLKLIGTGESNGNGNDLNNAITGNDATNVLSGNSGSDTLDGGANNDILNGGTGNDIYIVDSSSDIINEASALVTEVDAVQASVNYYLPSNVENLSLTGTTAIEGIGNALNNTIIGNSADNLLNGDTGNDSVYGGAGNDLILGSSVADPNDGSDFLFGEAGDDELYGFFGNDTLDGGTENDSLYGREDNDLLKGGDGNDILKGGSDSLTNNTGNDIVYGGVGNDTIDGQDGNDSLYGGEGNDQFVYDTYSPFTTVDIGIDEINDFTTSIDTIVLGKNTFNVLASEAGIGFGVSTDFDIVSRDTSAATSNAAIVYNFANGNLFYNQNLAAAGLGTGAQFAHFVGSLTHLLSATDFIIQDLQV